MVLPPEWEILDKKLAYFPKKKLILPEGFYLDSSKVPSGRSVNNLLISCGIDFFPNFKLELAIKNSNFFLRFMLRIKNKFMVLSE